jgi:hypothetical protein
LRGAGIPADPTTLGVFNTDHAYGTPEEVIRHVEQLRQAGADEVICLIQMGTVPLEVCLQTIRMWGEHVIPHFRRAEAVAADEPGSGLPAQPVQAAAN